MELLRAVATASWLGLGRHILMKRRLAKLEIRLGGLCAPELRQELQ